MKNRLKYFVVSLAAVVLLVSGAIAASPPPNVILILIDDMGWADSSTYGSTYYQTPNLTRLAEEGMLFTDAYAASPLCSPTRASIMSGQYPARLRITVAITPKNVEEPKALPPEGNAYCGKVQNKNHMPLEVFTLAEALKEKGYNTAHIGKWHLMESGMNDFRAEHQGFDYVIGGGSLPGPPDYYSPYKNSIPNLKAGPKGEYLNERMAEESIKWINSVKDSGKPFYLNFWHYAVHGPIIAKKDLLPKYNELRDPNADQRCPEMGTMLESMDNSIGILLDWLDQPKNRELKKNTVILLTSDNGGVTHNEINGNPWTSNRPLRGGKANTYEGGFKVPWIVSWPGKIKAGSSSATPVQSLDIYPTVLELAKVKPRAGSVIDGQSIVPLLAGKPMAHQPIFTDFQHVFGGLCAPSSCVRAGDWKLIRFHHAGIDAKSDAFELFNLKLDPSEAINLADYMPGKVAELDQLIETHLKEIDALLPIANKNFKGNPIRRRHNPKQAPNRPKKLRLAETKLVAAKAGSRTFQLLDEKNRTRKTHALVLEGAEWVTVENCPDGSVAVTWTAPPANTSAKVLFGWKGGATCMEINDWTIPACELLIQGTDSSLRLSRIFADDMVLQANAPLPVWGWAEPGNTVTVEFAGQTKTGVATAGGKWQVILDPMPASFEPRSMTVISQVSGVKFQVSSILVGEVWLCAGQSNMRMTVRGVNAAKKEMSEANFPDIRFFTVPSIGNAEPQEDVDANWQICSPQSVANLTATGYFFGRKLHQDLEVPIGLIDISYGGATITTFMDAETVRRTVSNDLIYKHDQISLGKKELMPYQISSYCYNAMVAPVVPYAVRGTIWYQGESNVGTPEEYISWYRDYMGMMRAKFRNPDMPFYHVQLAGFINQHNTKMVPETWARFRLAQERILEESNTGMATAMDIGMKDNIHPKNKQEVGRRLALCALNQTYGKMDLVCEGPLFKSLKKKGSKVAVTFSNCEDGLKLNGDFGGFTGLLEDGTSVDLTGKITGADRVEIDLADHDIKRLRYAYANFPVCPLVNGAGLPALSFDQLVN